MEANKSDALECLTRAKAYLSSETDRTRAMRLLQKSLKLYRTDEASDLLDAILNVSNNRNDKRQADEQPTTASNRSTNGAPHEEEEEDEATESKKNPHEEEHTRRRLTERELAMKRVKGKTNLYEILDLDKRASQADIAKAYRRLALLLHPDKNPTRGASDCFKAVGKAFKILSDPKSRADYDMSLLQPTFTSSRSATGTNRSYRSYNVWEDDLDFPAEEFFRAFFGNHYDIVYGGGGLLRRPGQGGRSNNQNGRNTRAAPAADEGIKSRLVAAGCIIAFILVSNLLTPQDQFQFNPSSRYSILRTSQRLGIKYYMKNTDDVTDDNRAKFEEEQVESRYINEVHAMCINEKNRKIDYINHVRLFGTSAALKKATEMPTPACKEHVRLVNLVKSTTAGV